MTEPNILEPIAARGWPAAECGTIGGWRLHASSGCSGRINACWPMGAPGLSADEALDAAEAWYRRRGLQPRFKLVDGCIDPPDLGQRLAARGYRPGAPTLTMTGALGGEIDPDAHIADVAGEAFRRVFADPDFGDDADAAERLEAFDRIPPPRGFAVIWLDGAPAAVGACAIEGEWAGVMGMRTSPAFRRRGLARRIFRTLTGYARSAGATLGYLQVDEHNLSAVALYRDEGFGPRYRYRYWTKP